MLTIIGVNAVNSTNIDYETLEPFFPQLTDLSDVELEALTFSTRLQSESNIDGLQESEPAAPLPVEGAGYRPSSARRYLRSGDSW
jgi:hypothetical protein